MSPNWFSIILTAVLAGLGLAGLALWHWLAEKFSSGDADKWFQRLKVVLEILLILGGTYFAAYKFIYTEWVTWNKPLYFTSTLDSTDFDAKKTCLTEFVIDVENRGKIALDVIKTEAFLWAIDAPSEPKSIEVYESLMSKPSDETKKELLAKKEWWPNKGLAWNYPPGSKFRDSFAWIHKPMPEHILIARIDLYTNSDSKEPEDSHYSWTKSCPKKMNDLLSNDLDV